MQEAAEGIKPPEIYEDVTKLRQLLEVMEITDGIEKRYKAFYRLIGSGESKIHFGGNVAEQLDACLIETVDGFEEDPSTTTKIHSEHKVGFFTKINVPIVFADVTTAQRHKLLLKNLIKLEAPHSKFKHYDCYADLLVKRFKDDMEMLAQVVINLINEIKGKEKATTGNGKGKATTGRGGTN